MEQNTAENIVPVVESSASVQGEPRAVFVAKMRELADKVEAGVLDGARCEWADGLPAMVTVEVDLNNGRVHLERTRLVDSRPKLTSVG